MPNPYNIKTESGKVLWEKINNKYGSAVWGAVGEGIEAVEAEVEQRIIKLLEAQEVEGWFDRGLKQHFIALIKGEQK